MTDYAQIQSLTVDSFTSPCPVCVDEASTLEQVMEIMRDNGIRHIPVVRQDGRPVGIISDRDVAPFKFVSQWDSVLAKDVMTAEPIAVTSGASLVDVAYEMSSSKVGSVLVNDAKGRVQGIFTSTDALNALVEVLRGDILSE